MTVYSVVARDDEMTSTTSSHFSAKSSLKIRNTNLFPTFLKKLTTNSAESADIASTCLIKYFSDFFDMNLTKTNAFLSLQALLSQLFHLGSVNAIDNCCACPNFWMFPFASTFSFNILRCPNFGIWSHHCWRCELRNWSSFIEGDSDLHETSGLVLVDGMSSFLENSKVVLDEGLLR